ncbi:MAG: 23S rRNA pseudouridine(2605) synthase RluB [Gammaproteobacteria bacterium]|nr:23S rRNA pseudouridine(2605) synthase RluB [Gammaproteobacteria bacterium]MDX5375788.1 23S rRNA pseudouridine(2605) synthase RluB [Gammaproteobacteria bacterium]
MAERLQKLLARAGYGSRREIERLIEQGQITINGKPATPGDHASETDAIAIRGEPVALSRVSHFKARVIAYHKPVGEVCTRDDPEGRPTVFDHLPRMQSSRWVAVGRMDINTVGLMLFTNDGELANRLMHPSGEIEREYAVRVLGEVDDAMMKRLLAGVELEDGPAAFETLERAGGEGANTWFRVTLKEGRKREVRRLWESQGVTVSRLIRVRYGPIELQRALKPGRWADLKPREMRQLYEAVGLKYVAPKPKPGVTGSRPPSTSRRSASRPAEARGPRSRDRSGGKSNPWGRGGK